MIVKQHFHQEPNSKLSATDIQNVKTILVSAEWIKRKSAKEFRSDILRTLAELGWSDRVRIDQRSNINITSVLHETGLCIQTGNMSRFYADILKLETLFRKNLIKGAIYIIPLKSWANEIGSNVANYERLIEELDIFSATVTIPIVVFGISGRN